MPLTHIQHRHKITFESGESFAAINRTIHRITSAQFNTHFATRKYLTRTTKHSTQHTKLFRNNTRFTASASHICTSETPANPTFFSLDYLQTLIIPTLSFFFVFFSFIFIFPYFVDVLRCHDLL